MDRKKPAKPTRLLRAPERCGWAIVFTTDAGIFPNSLALSKAIGVSPASLYQRIRYYGWNNPHIFSGQARPGYRIDGGSAAARSGGTYQAGGGADNDLPPSPLAQLSGRTRSRNLDRIPPAGSLELRYLNK